MHHGNLPDVSLGVIPLANWSLYPSRAKGMMVKHGQDPNSTIGKPGATTAVPPHSGLQLRSQCGHGPNENLASKLAHCFPGNASRDDTILISQGDAPVYVSVVSKTTGNNDTFDQYVVIPFHLHQPYGLAKWLRIWEDTFLRACTDATPRRWCLSALLYAFIWTWTCIQQWDGRRIVNHFTLSISFRLCMTAWRGHHNGICHSEIEAMYNPPADNHHGHSAAWSVVIHRPLGSVDVVFPRWFIH